MNTLPPLPLVDGCLFVDNSFLDLFACPRKLQYNQLEKKVPTAENDALNFGSAIHLAMEFRYRNLNMSLFEVESIQAQILQQFFSEHSTNEGDHRSLNFATEVVHEYNQRYLVEPFSTLQHDTSIKCSHCKGECQDCLWCFGTGKESIMAEMSFAVPLFEYRMDRHTILTQGLNENDYIDAQGRQIIPVFYTGKIDLPVLWDGHLTIIDHKTASVLGASYFDQHKISSQLIGYCWAFEQLTKQKVNAFVVNAIRTKEPTQAMLAGTAKPDAVQKWWDESFARSNKEYVQPWRFEEWKQNVTSLIEEFFWHYNRGYMPMKVKQCTHFGKCPFYDVCYVPPEQRHMLLGSDQYRENDWTPLKDFKPKQT